jgi:hypothetical protein
MIGVDEAARYCTHCGAVKTTRFCTNCGAGTMAPPAPVLDRYERSLNWGGFFLPGFWPFWNGASSWGLAWWALVFVAAFTRIFAIGTLAIGIYLLLRGNRIALEHRTFRTPDEFCGVQRRWGTGDWGCGLPAASCCSC